MVINQNTQNIKSIPLQNLYMNNKYKKKIIKSELMELPIKSFEGEIIIIDNKEKANEVAEILKKQKILGFDTETRPSFRKGVYHKVALLQLATSKQAFLFRLNKIGLAESVKAILADDKIMKVGVAIKDDIKALQKLKPFNPAFFVELQKYVKRFDIEDLSLAKLSGIVLGFRISKRQQLSNWENKALSPAQIKYASTDAWVSCEIYKKLKKSQIKE